MQHPKGQSVILLNFTHPLTAAQRGQIQALTGEMIAKDLGEMAQFDDQPLAEQIVALVDGVGLSAEEWQTLPLLLNPPGFAPATAALLAELHGRTGYFLPIIRLRKLVDNTPLRWEVAEIVNLQKLRDQARLKRTGG